MGDSRCACGRGSPQPLSHNCPPVCAHLTTFRYCLLPLLIVKSPLAARDCQRRRRPCCPCRCRCCLRLRLHLCLAPVGCCGARRHTSCWCDGIGEGICATCNGLLRAPQATVVTRGRESKDDLEPPTAAAWVTVATPTVIVCHEHRCAQASSFLIHHCRRYFVVGV